jgi:mono/diheme cytochrome c family protein
MKSMTSLVCALTLGAALMGAATTAQAADAAAGKAFYEQEYAGNKYATSSSLSKVGCITCHGANLASPGSHIKTGKTIGPMAASRGYVDDKGIKRYTDAAKMEKWFTRNCNGVLGRECSATEKTDFLAYVKSQ